MMKKGFFIGCFLAVFSAVNVFGAKLPDGSVQGLPQNLIVMDENGYSPEDGELYIYIENMNPNEVYSKDIAIMNAREDAQYAIYMTATPNYSKGNIDLLGETVCKLYLDDKLIYEGLVNGDGTPNMQEEALDLGGVLASGESRNLHADFQWVTDMNWERNEEGENEYYGEVSFIWTFYASIPTPGNNDTPGSDPDPKEPTTLSGGGGGGGSSYYPEGNTDTSSPKEHTEPPTHDYEGVLPDDPNDEAILSEIIENSEEPTTEGVIDKLVDKLPIPEDVKTGYHSKIVFYTKIALCAFFAAAVILAVMLGKWFKLKKLKGGRIGG